MIKMQLAAQGHIFDSQRSDADSIQSDYVKQKLKQIDSQKSLRQDSMASSSRSQHKTIQRIGTGSSNQARLMTKTSQSVKAMALGLN